MSERECSFTESIAALALRALPRDEEETVRSHLATCPACRLRYEEALAVVSLLPYAAAEQAPPPHLRQRILALAAADAGGRPPVGAGLPGAGRPGSPGTPAGLRGWLRLPGWVRLRGWRPWIALAAAVWVLSLGGALWQVNRLSRRLALLEAAASPSAAATGPLGEVEVVLAATPAAPGAVAEVATYLDPGRRGRWIRLVARGLPRLEPGEAYQLWLIHGQERRSGGVFIVDASGSGSLAIWVPDDVPVDSLGVSREPDPYGTAPRGPRVLYGRLDLARSGQLRP
ncbi:anti-sigma factor [Caldinitratiruptor microaerophilus]|nr:anti-sigma factor [Caldinitratiruptor microaerophilus]